MGFEPPPYPYDRLDGAKAKAAALPGGVVDLSVGTPCDPPPAAVLAALAGSNSERGYPPSVGTVALRSAAARWIDRRFGVAVDVNDIAACIGTKEFVATLPQWLKLRTPERDTVLYPEVAYPTYEMGAVLAGCRAVAVPVDEKFRMRIDAISVADANRALCLWVNSPGNPAGNLDDLGAAAAFGRRHGVPVFSDECYAEFTWDDVPRSILQHGTDGVIAVHSLSKRSNLAGVRVGFYAGDHALVHYLSEVRKHVGLMVPGPAQAAGVAALDDDAHVAEQRERYRNRLLRCADILQRWSGTPIDMPSGGFYLWLPTDDAWGFTERLAAEGGALVSPGEFYGMAGAGRVRVAVVQPDDRIDLVATRLGV
ncbi:MAG: aminotransferase class I/II-fold pyridoxal phosphate-dependent enzyme [Acidimicrobiia bacterium]